MITLTPYLGLKKLEYRDTDYPDWGTVENENMDILDLAFGDLLYTEENYVTSSTPPAPPTPITIVESHSLSLDYLDIELEKDALLMPTEDQKVALQGEGTPAASNKYATKNYVRVARKRILFPEGVGSVLTPSPGGSNSGNMTTTKEAHGNYVYNYYQWLSTEATFQNYDISIQWRVPETFLSWHATRALIVDICTKENTTTNNKVEVILRKDGIAGSVTSGEVCSTVANDWYSEREIPLASLIFAGTGAPFSTLATGDILNITIRVSSKENGTSNAYVKIGAVTIQYTG